MKLFTKENVNNGRQIEFDIAKVVCILGMVFVHCFEELPMIEGSAGGDAAYYVFVVVLDCLFGAGTFMTSMGLGIAYTWKDNPDSYIRRGLKIFLMGYALNFLHDGLRGFLEYLILGDMDILMESVNYAFYVDIMIFAGLALMAYGFLKKLKLSDLQIFGVSVVLSVIGSFVREIDFGNAILAQLFGPLFGTVNPYVADNTGTAFPFFNWFIIVAGGVLYAGYLRKCTDLDRYYTISLIVSSVVLGTYLVLTVPKGLGMMSGEMTAYYHMRTPDAIIVFIGAIFSTSLYHMVAKLLSDRMKQCITHISSNINQTYITHWLIIGLATFILEINYTEGISTMAIVIIASVIFVAANVIADIFVQSKKELLL